MPQERLPEAIERALCEIFGPLARQVRIVPNSRYARLHAGATATTRRNRIYLRGSVEHFAADHELLLHEYFHVVRQWRTRRLSIGRYLVESFKRGYRNNRFEVEAREFASANRARLAGILARSPAR